MLLDIKNFIPDNDTIYNLVFETDIFSKLKEKSERHRMKLLKIWDQHKKNIDQNLKEILRFSLKEDYHIIALPPIMDSVLTVTDCNTMGWGNRNDLEDSGATLTNMVYCIVQNEIGNFDKSYKEFVDVVLELAIQNELYTRMSGKSNYLGGDPTLTFLKRQIYPLQIFIRI